MTKTEKIFMACAELEVLCENHRMREATFKIVELLGIVTGYSKCAEDVDHAVSIYLEKMNEYEVRKAQL